VRGEQTNERLAHGSNKANPIEKINGALGK
jgi:hypothetical protein